MALVVGQLLKESEGRVLLKSCLGVTRVATIRRNQYVTNELKAEKLAFKSASSSLDVVGIQHPELFGRHHDKLTFAIAIDMTSSSSSSMYDQFPTSAPSGRGFFAIHYNLLGHSGRDGETTSRHRRRDQAKCDKNRASYLRCCLVRNLGAVFFLE
jgi:hypothetical protein